MHSETITLSGEEQLKDILDVVTRSQAILRNMLMEVKENGGLQLNQYVRYLSMQHHLTRGVQRHFLIAASHPSLSGRRRLREFLFEFGLEEESHYKMAE